MEFIKFPEINQFRNVVKEVQRTSAFVGTTFHGDEVLDYTQPKPVIPYRGTVKLHGTNAAVVFDLINDECHIQSRKRIISWKDDNAGFAAFMEPKLAELQKTLPDLWPVEGHNVVAVFGEWCGGSIQKGVALNQVDKMFVIFAVKHNDRWLSPSERECIDLPELGIYSNTRFATFWSTIDFNNPEEIQNQLAELTKLVEAKCPVSAFFGANGIGEGIVWTPVEPKWNHSRFWFKVKGEKHSTSKVKTLAAVDVEKVNSIKEFVTTVVTDNRCNQGMHEITNGDPEAFTQKDIGTFIRWVFEDIVKEESDVIQASGLEKKEVGSAVAKAAKTWLFANAV